MSSARPFSLPAAAALALALCACGEPDSPEAAPGAVERATEALDRDQAAERQATIERRRAEADDRARRAERRIAAGARQD